MLQGGWMSRQLSSGCVARHGWRCKQGPRAQHLPRCGQPALRGLPKQPSVWSFVSLCRALHPSRQCSLLPPAIALTSQACILVVPRFEWPSPPCCVSALQARSCSRPPRWASSCCQTRPCSSSCRKQRPAPTRCRRVRSCWGGEVFVEAGLREVWRAAPARLLVLTAPDPAPLLCWPPRCCRRTPRSNTVAWNQRCTTGRAHAARRASVSAAPTHFPVALAIRALALAPACGLALTSRGSIPGLRSLASQPLTCAVTLAIPNLVALAQPLALLRLPIP